MPETDGESRGRILGVDFGERRIGLALSDPLGLIAQPLATLHADSLDDGVRKVAEVAGRVGATQIVVGYPLLLSGERGELARRVERFAEALARASGLVVVKWDERMTTALAERVLRGERQGRRSGGPGGRRSPGERRARAASRGRADRMAASLVLASYLERFRQAGGTDGET